MVWWYIITLIFLPKFLFVFLSLYLESFCQRSSVMWSLVSGGWPRDEVLWHPFPLARVCHGKLKSRQHTPSVCLEHIRMWIHAWMIILSAWIFDQSTEHTKYSDGDALQITKLIISGVCTKIPSIISLAPMLIRNLLSVKSRTNIMTSNSIV